MKLNWKLKVGRETNQITILGGNIDFFLTTLFCHANHLLLECEPLMLFTSVDSLGVDPFSILLIIHQVIKRKSWCSHDFHVCSLLLVLIENI